MNTVLSLIVAFCCGIRARFMTCAEAEAYFSTMHFHAHQAGEECVALMLALSGKPGSQREEWNASGITTCTAHLG